MPRATSTGTTRLLPNREALLERVKKAAVMKPQPELHIRADKETRYEAVGRVIYTIQRGGIVKVGFITEPRTQRHAARGSRSGDDRTCQ